MGRRVGYQIERATSQGGTYTVVATVGPNIQAYANTGLNRSTTYWYRVSAINAVGSSAPAGPVSAATLAR